MSPDSRRDVLGDRDSVSDDSGAGKTSPPEAVQHRIRVLDTRAWEANHTEPFRFMRWLGALATAVSGLIESYTAHIAMPYLPTLLGDQHLILPDARSAWLLSADPGLGSTAHERGGATARTTSAGCVDGSLRVIVHDGALRSTHTAVGGSELGRRKKRQRLCRNRARRRKTAWSCRATFQSGCAYESCAKYVYLRHPGMICRPRPGTACGSAGIRGSGRHSNMASVRANMHGLHLPWPSAPRSGCAATAGSMQSGGNVLRGRPVLTRTQVPQGRAEPAGTGAPRLAAVRLVGQGF